MDLTIREIKEALVDARADLKAKKLVGINPEGNALYKKMRERSFRCAEAKLKALQLALEIAEGKAHVMRWADGDPVTVNGRLICSEDFKAFGIFYGDVCPPSTTHYATFNGSPEIPMPKENE